VGLGHTQNLLGDGNLPTIIHSIAMVMAMAVAEGGQHSGSIEFHLDGHRDDACLLRSVRKDKG
jgi:hypothetical protein